MGDGVLPNIFLSIQPHRGRESDMVESERMSARSSPGAMMPDRRTETISENDETCSLSSI